MTWPGSQEMNYRRVNEIPLRCGWQLFCIVRLWEVTATQCFNFSAACGAVNKPVHKGSSLTIIINIKFLCREFNLKRKYWVVGLMRLVIRLCSWFKVICKAYLCANQKLKLFKFKQLKLWVSWGSILWLIDIRIK